MSRSASASSLALALVLGLTPSATRVSAPAPEKVYLTVEEALRLAFPKCDVTKETYYLTDAQKRQAEKLSGESFDSAIVRAWVAKKDRKLVGTAYVDAHKVRTARETLFVVVDPERRVSRVELLSFAEPPEYAPRAEWFAQFRGRPLDDELQLKRAIRGIAGATLSARAGTGAVRRLLAAHEVLNPPPPPPK